MTMKFEISMFSCSQGDALHAPRQEDLNEYFGESGRYRFHNIQ